MKSQPGKLARRSIGHETVETTYDFMMNIKPKEKTLCEFIYESKTGKFLTRTPRSWCELIFFYSIFYIGLSALFAVCLKGLLFTIDETSPKWKLSESLIGINPGLGFRPIAHDVDQGSLVWYDSSNSTQIKYWTDLIETFLNDSSTASSNQITCEFDTPPHKKQVCKVDKDHFGDCSVANEFGYRAASPCIFLKLNRIFDWVPEYYNDTNNLPAEMPAELKKYIADLDPSHRNQVWISCEGENGNDKEILGPTTYFPTRGFPSYFYPYTNLKGYHSPLVAVKFLRPKPGQIINIECRTWAKNIIYSGSHRDRKGSVHFELMIDTPAL